MLMAGKSTGDASWWMLSADEPSRIGSRGDWVKDLDQAARIEPSRRKQRRRKSGARSSSKRALLRAPQRKLLNGRRVRPRRHPRRGFAAMTTGVRDAMTTGARTGTAAVIIAAVVGTIAAVIAAVIAVVIAVVIAAAIAAAAIIVTGEAMIDIQKIVIEHAQ
jgi:hypothetical protein